MSGPPVAVFDYGSGNIASVQRALVRAGARVCVTDRPAAAAGAAGLVVPGVGAFAACMAGIRAAGGDELVRERVAAGRPVLGICVGMQVLFAGGDEHGVRTAGIGVWPGEVRRLAAPVLPHIGWNTVTAPAASVLFAGCAAERFYFVHSYAAAAGGRGLVTRSHHGEDFLAAVEDGPVSATQFHPEKSGAAGAAVLAAWVGSL